MLVPWADMEVRLHARGVVAATAAHQTARARVWPREPNRTERSGARGPADEGERPAEHGLVVRRAPESPRAHPPHSSELSLPIVFWSEFRSPGRVAQLTHL